MNFTPDDVIRHSNDVIIDRPEPKYSPLRDPVRILPDEGMQSMAGKVAHCISTCRAVGQETLSGGATRGALSSHVAARAARLVEEEA